MQKKMILFVLASAVVVSSFADTSKTNSIVTDNTNALYWQDNASSQKSSEDWHDAVLYCDTLVINNVSKWRLPTFEELLSVVDYARVNPAIDSNFTFVKEGTYWTSTAFSPSKARAWTIDFRTGKTYYNYTTTNHAVRCVKDIPRELTKDNK